MSPSGRDLTINYFSPGPLTPRKISNSKIIRELETILIWDYTNRTSCQHVAVPTRDYSVVIVVLLLLSRKSDRTDLQTPPTFWFWLHTCKVFCDCIKTNAGRWHKVEGPVAPRLVAPLLAFKLVKIGKDWFCFLLCTVLMLSHWQSLPKNRQIHTWHSLGNHFCHAPLCVSCVQEDILPRWGLEFVLLQTVLTVLTSWESADSHANSFKVSCTTC